MLYNILLILGTLFVLPKWLLQKKYRGTLSQRFGLKLPKASSTPSIWIHTVSMGETRAMISIYQRLREKYPTKSIYISSTTKTGHEEAKRSLKGATDYFYLPLDFSWTMKALCNRLQPELLILSESDFWPHLLQTVKKRGGKILLLNGKISERSQKRFSAFSYFAKPLFSSIDHFCVQNQEYRTRFEKLQVPEEKLTITGNLKLSIPPAPPKDLGLDTSDPIITIGSTHAGEEELLLMQLAHLKYKVLLVPRHPERFEAARKIAEHYPNVTLIDQMGVLPSCYRLAEFAIVGGSFVPGIGGHNIFEPIQAHIPVIFGPHMDTQKELVKMVLEAKAGIQTRAEELPKALSELQKNYSVYKENAKTLSENSGKALEASWQTLQTFLS